MYRFFVTTLLFFVTFITAFEVWAENVTKMVEVINGFEFGYGTDAASGKLYLKQTCGPHNNFSNNNIYIGASDGQGTTANVSFTFDGPVEIGGMDPRYPLSQFSVIRCRAHFTKTGFLPIFKDFPFLVSWVYGTGAFGDVLKWRVKATIEFPNWDNPNDPFGDGGGGGDDTDTDGDGTPDDEDEDDDNDGIDDVNDPDPKDPGVPGDDPDDPDDPDGDPENDCTCGACCSCKCTCGNWSGVTCSGTCWHYGHGDTPMPSEMAGHYCECHHQDGDGDEEDEECCPHHAAIQGATERSADAAESIDGKLDGIDDKLGGIDDKLSGIDDKLTFVNPGDYVTSILSFDIPGIGVPLPTAPEVSVPSLSLPEVGEVTEHPLTYFERKGFGELPSFSYDKLFKELSAKVEGKFGLQSLSQKFMNPAASNFDLSFMINFGLPGFNVHVGPHKVDVGKHIDNYASSPIANIVRLIVLAYLGICFISALIKMIFLTPW